MDIWEINMTCQSIEIDNNFYLFCIYFWVYHIPKYLTGILSVLMFDCLFSDQLNDGNIAKPDTDTVHCLQLFPVVINACEYKLELWAKRKWSWLEEL